MRKFTIEDFRKAQEQFNAAALPKPIRIEIKLRFTIALKAYRHNKKLYKRFKHIPVYRQLFKNEKTGKWEEHDYNFWTDNSTKENKI